MLLSPSSSSYLEAWRPELPASLDGKPLITTVAGAFQADLNERYPTNPITAFFLRWETVVGMIILYVLGIKLCALIRDATGFQANKSPAFRSLVALHNLGLAIFSAVSLWNTLIVTASSVSKHGWYGWGGIGCDASHSVWNEGLGAWVFIFYLSKYYEFLDTYILVLKGKNPSFLQVFHHIGAAVALWGIVQSQGSWVFYSVCFNTWIHTMMYTYFFIKTLYPDYDIKAAKYLTMLQMFQFVSGLVFSAHWQASEARECLSQSSFFYLMFLQSYVTVLLGLFAHFAKRRYPRTSINKKTASGSTTESPRLERPRGQADATHTKKVKDCYSYYEDMSNFVGISDYTDGIYNGKRDTDYEEAQVAQANYLLDQAKIGPGSRLLDVGCGRGRILQAAKERGAEVVGITISPEQARYCRSKGLDVRVINYRELEHKKEWHGKFDAIIANGSMEHFVSTKEGLARQAGELYGKTFDIYHKLIDPNSDSRRVVTTVIHHRRRNGKTIDLSLSDKVMFSLLAEAYGGWYPLDGQLEKSAAGHFRSVAKVDGTEDYLWTSIDGFDAMRQKRNANIVGYLRQLAATGLRAPLFAVNPWIWTWQFQGSKANPPPTVLWRHTWEYVAEE